MSETKQVEPDYHAEMRLPPGKTCGDCVHLSRCIGFGFTSSAENVSCDFWPRRYREPVKAA